ncbi:MAG: alcohol dehydrogenase [Alphaproteobacteria bacterium HGW-Alphaproteobacteria-5]|nr:MAG: alcohol dehydrogenase [Alphaproteobacteria bacterium HGW-Alphaproteobacteria-5]
MKIRAAIARAADKPFEIGTCDLVEPAAGEVLVHIKACGVCHTDLAAKLQHIPVPMPIVLGHEGAGVVEKVGAGVSNVQPGDHVLMSFASCGTCLNCADGAPGYCDHFIPINIFGARAEGPTLSENGSPIAGHFFAQSAFATHAIATARNVVKIDKSLPLELLAPLGCGIQTGMGSVMLVLKPQAGDSIVVFGAGAVGLSAVIAAKIVGCTTIIAVDIKDSRLALAREVGATHAINGANEDALARIMEITGSGAHASFDTTGVPAVAQQAFNCLRARGQAAYVAAPPFGTQYEVDANVLVSTGRSLRGIIEGDVIPADFIPRMIEFYRAGMLPLEKLVTAFPFEQINEAVAASEQGEVVKAVLLME